MFTGAVFELEFRELRQELSTIGLEEDEKSKWLGVEKCT